MLKSKTRLGNWFEEIAFEEDKRNLQKNIQQSGGTLTQTILAKVQHHITPTTLDTPTDKYLHYGTQYMLQSAGTNGVLSVDMDDRHLGALGWKVVGSTALATSSVIRNTWMLVPASGDAAEGGIVRYGEKLLLVCVPALASPPVCLASEMKSPQSCARLSSNQEVYFSPNGGSACFWSVQFGNAEFREDVVGEPVCRDSLVVLRHQATANFLGSSEQYRFTNDFGSECELFCAKIQLFASKLGKAPEQKENLWLFVANEAQ